MKPLKNIHADTLLILLILLVGAILRFYDYTGIPFTHDELSALIRTRFDNFHDLIRNGVKVDGHPAGVQVFLYYWIKLAGTSEAMVKLPFTLFGLASVYLTYLIGKRWFSSATALISASFLAFLQYPVMYSQIARPYASGLFLCLLLVYFWTNLMLSPQRKYYLNLSGYILASAMCAYNHHFSLLFCAMAGMTGVFIIEQKRRLSFILSWLFIFLLYIPHLPIFFYQLRLGGIGGWLSKPRPDFILDYLSYVFQFSWYLTALIIILLVLSFVWRKKGEKTDYRLVIVSFIWFFIPLLTGYLYSILVNPVLQYSLLIFSFPFLFFFLFFFANTEKAWQKVIMVALSAALIIPSLIFERLHYRLFYTSPYREILVEAKKSADSLGRSSCFLMIDTQKSLGEFYLEQAEFRDFKVDYMHDVFSPAVIAKIADTCHSRYFIYGCVSNADPVDYAIIRSKYPWLIAHKCYNEADLYIFGRDSCRNINEYYFSSGADFISNRTGWFNLWPNGIWYTASEPETPVYRLEGTEFSPGFRVSLRDICRHKNDIIDMIAQVETSENFSEAWLQLGLYSKQELLLFRNASIGPGKTGEFRKIFCSLRLADIDWRHHYLNVQGFIWNPGKQDIVIRSMSFRIRDGNQVLYGLYRKIE